MTKFKIENHIDRCEEVRSWKNGKITHDVSLKNSFSWKSKDQGFFEIYSREPQGDVDFSLGREVKNFATQLAREFDEVDLTMQSLQKNLKVSSQKHVLRREYFDLLLRKKNQTWRYVAPLAGNWSVGAREWLVRLREFFGSPEDQGHFAFRQVELMPTAFAQMLYFGLAKKLNPQWGGAPIGWPQDWKTFPACNFDVWDVPGESDWLGYAPYGDDGVVGKRIRIFEGQTGSQEVIVGRSGNRRFSNDVRMPSVQTRCLWVKSTEERPPLDRQSTLIVQSCESAEFQGDRVELVTHIQWMMSPYRNLLRLPPVRIRIPLVALPRFQVFGNSGVSHFSSDSRASISQGVGVSVKCPSAWARSRLGGISFEPL